MFSFVPPAPSSHRLTLRKEHRPAIKSCADSDRYMIPHSYHDCKVFFLIFLLFFPAAGHISEFSPLFLVGRAVPPLEGLVDQHDIVPELLHTVPRDVVILSPAEQSEKPAGTKYDDGLHRSLRKAYLQIPHVAKATAVAKIDDLLTPQLAKSHKHISHLKGTICAGRAVLFRRFHTLFASENNSHLPRKYWKQTNRRRRAHAGKGGDLRHQHGRSEGAEK